MPASLTAEADTAAAVPKGRPKLLWDLWSLAVGQTLSVVLGFAAFAYLARTLSPESYGLVEYAVGLAGLGAIVIEGGMGSLGTLHVSRDPRRAAELAARVPAARLLIALAVVPLVALSAAGGSFDGTVRTLIWLFALSLLAVPFKQDWLLQGLDRMTLVSPGQALKSGVFALGVVLVVDGDAQLAEIGVVEAVAASVGAAYFIAAQRFVSVPLRLDLRVSRAWELVRAGASIGASNMLWPFMAYAPILLVTTLVGSIDAAWLGAAQRIVVALVSFSALYFFNLYPLLGRGLREDRDGWGRLMGSSFRVIAWSSIGFALAVGSFATTIVTAVFGEAYALAAPVLTIAIWILPLRLLSGHARWTLLAAERQRGLLGVEIGCAASIVLLGAALVPRYGAAGGALAGVLGNVIGWLLADRYARRHVGPLPGVGQAALPVAGALASAGVAWVIGGSELRTLALTMGTYAGCMWLTAPQLFGDAVRVAHAKRMLTDSGEP